MTVVSEDSIECCAFDLIANINLSLCQNLYVPSGCEITGARGPDATKNGLGPLVYQLRVARRAPSRLNAHKFILKQSDTRVAIDCYSAIVYTAILRTWP